MMKTEECDLKSINGTERIETQIGGGNRLKREDVSKERLEAGRREEGWFV